MKTERESALEALDDLVDAAQSDDDIGRDERLSVEDAVLQRRDVIRAAITNPAPPTVPEAPGRIVGSFSHPGDNPGERRIGVRVQLNDPDSYLHGHCEWIRSALAQSGEGRAGWKLVPVEPTEAMLKAASDALNAAKEPEDWSQGGDIGDDNADVYRAMLAAAPEPEE